MSQQKMDATNSAPEFLPRPIRPEDVASVHALIDACYREYGLVLNLDDECESHIRDPVTYFRAHGGEFWALHREGRVMATVALVVHKDRKPPLAELKSMYVDRSWRRRGIGRRLVLLVVDAAKAAGCAQIELWSDKRFTAAHAMYESLGFARFGQRELGDSNNSSEYGYRRGL